jgi:hypothetical protein
MKSQKIILGDVLANIARLLTYLPVYSIKLCLKIVKFLRKDTARLISFFSLLGVVAFSRFLVKRAQNVRLMH